MATVDGTQLPELLRAELKKLLADVRPGDLLDYARAHPEFIRGFRLTKNSAKVIRQRLSTLIAEEGALPVELKNILIKNNPVLSGISSLSEKFLLSHSQDLIALHGPVALAGFLFDERRAVRKMAAPWLEESEDLKNVTLEAETDVELDLLAQFAWMENPTEQKAAKDETMPRKHTMGKNRQEQSKVADGSAKFEKRIQKKIDKYDEQISRLEAKLTKERSQKKELNEELRKISSELEAVRDRARVEQAAAIRKTRDETLKTWLAEPARIDQEVRRLQKSKENDLLSRIGNALDSQAKIDRQTGNRQVLQRRLDDLLQAKKQLLDVRENALSPLPVLQDLLVELDHEIHTTQALLGGEGSEDALLANLKASINSAHTADDIDRQKHLLAALEAAGVLPPDTMAQLYGIYETQLERHFDLFGWQGKKTTEKKNFLLAGKVKKGVKAHLVVDGHNVLFGLPRLFGNPSDSDIPSSETREELLKLVDCLVAQTSSRATVFFDGAERQEKNFSLHVKEIFSGGGEARMNRADEAIIGYLETQIILHPKVSCLLVSNDRELVEKAEALGAMSISLQQFSAAVLQQC